MVLHTALVSTDTPVESRENVGRNTSPEFHVDDFKKWVELLLILQ